MITKYYQYYQLSTTLKDDAMHSDINCHITTGCYAKHTVPQEADQQQVEQVHQHLPFDSYSEPANAKSVSDLKI
jgi:hypothetical protein